MDRKGAQQILLVEIVAAISGPRPTLRVTLQKHLFSSVETCVMPSRCAYSGLNRFEPLLGSNACLDTFTPLANYAITAKSTQSAPTKPIWHAN